MPSIPTVVHTNDHFQYRGLAYTVTGSNHDASLTDLRIVAARKLGDTTIQVSLGNHQKYIVQVVATTMASLSIAAALTAVYWFVLMRRNFRRDLILLLILSDLFKNFCYLMFGAATFTNGQVQDAGAFCQASGYMLQAGLEACDLAVLFISLHMTLQIFPMPNTRLGYKGLYNIRHWVVAVWFIVPNIAAALAFVNDGLAYQVVGAWCWLPVRPFWYRLALAWIPRYLITITILCFAIIIYVHVRSEFRIFERGIGSSSGNDATGSSSTPRTETAVGSIVPPSIPPTVASSEFSVIERVDTLAHETDVPPEVLAIRNARRHSLPVFGSPFEPRYEPFRQRHGSQSVATSRRGSRQVTFDFGPSAAEEPLSPRQQVTDPFIPPFKPAAPSAAMDVEDSTNIVIEEEPSPSAQVGDELDLDNHMDAQPADQTMENPLQTRRRAIKRQVRSLFVYPVAYLLFWIVPFVMHCMNYSDYFAEHPVLAVSIISSWCTTTLGLVDVIIFSWRERPWRHISGSDGTFIGSFCFWNFDRDLLYRRQAMDPVEIGEKRRSSSVPGILTSIKNWTWHRLSSVADTNNTHDSRGTRRATGTADNDIDLELQQGPERELQEKDLRFDTAGQRPGARNWFDNVSEVEEPRRARRPTWTQQ